MSLSGTTAEIDSGEPAGGAGELCALSAEAFAAGNVERARALARRALAIDPNAHGALQYASWLFSSLGDDPDTVAALGRLERHEPLSAAQNMVGSAASARLGDFATASAWAVRALELEPDSMAHAMQASAMLKMAGRELEAASILARSARIDRVNPYWLRELSLSANRLGMPEHSESFALAAWRLDKGNDGFALHAAGQLISNERYDEAIEILEHLKTRDASDPSVYGQLAFCACRLGDFAAAFVYAADGLRRFPQSVELLMQMGVSGCALGRYGEAADAFLAASRLTPDNGPALHGAFLALVEARRLEEATPIGGALLESRPDDADLGRTFHYVLAHRFVETPAGAEIGGLALAALKALHRPMQPPAKRRESGLMQQLRIIVALIDRETKTRFGRSSLGYLWALFEPLAHIAVMVTLINTFAHGLPPMGDSFAVFYFTGIIPYHLFTHTATQLSTAIPANRPLLQLPPVTTIGVFVSRALLEFVSELAVALALLAAFNVMGFSALTARSPADPRRAHLAVDLRPRDGARQLGADRLVSPLGKDLGRADGDALFRVGNVLHSAHDAGMATRHPGLEPGPAGDRGDARRLLPRRRAALARFRLSRGLRARADRDRPGPRARVPRPPADARMIRLREVSKVYRAPGKPPVTVLDRVSAEFPTGHNVGVLGLNGAGKSDADSAARGLGTAGPRSDRA